MHCQIAQISDKRWGAEVTDELVIQVHDMFSHRLWVWKGRTHVSEWVYRLGRGPWRHKHVGFGVSKKAARAIAQISDKRRGAAAKDEVVIRVHGVCLPPMGMDREDTCE